MKPHSAFYDCSRHSLKVSSGCVRAKCLSVSTAYTPLAWTNEEELDMEVRTPGTSRDTRGEKTKEHKRAKDSYFCKVDKTQDPHCGNKAWIASPTRDTKKVETWRTPKRAACVVALKAI